MPQALSSRRAVAAMVGLAALAAVGADAGARSADRALVVELNRVEDDAGGCRAFLVFDNRTEHYLSAFRLELVLFDLEGVVKRPLLVDMAPLRDGKRMVTSFLLDVPSCAAIGSILINDVPLCRNREGQDLDCVAVLVATSRTSIPLEL